MYMILNNKCKIIGWRCVLRCAGNLSGVTETKEEEYSWLQHLYCHHLYKAVRCCIMNRGDTYRLRIFFQDQSTPQLQWHLSFFLSIFFFFYWNTHLQMQPIIFYFESFNAVSRPLHRVMLKSVRYVFWYADVVLRETQFYQERNIIRGGTDLRNRHKKEAETPPIQYLDLYSEAE